MMREGFRERVGALREKASRPVKGGARFLGRAFGVSIARDAWESTINNGYSSNGGILAGAVVGAEVVAAPAMMGSLTQRVEGKYSFKSGMPTRWALVGLLLDTAVNVGVYTYATNSGGDIPTALAGKAAYNMAVEAAPTIIRGVASRLHSATSTLTL